MVSTFDFSLSDYSRLYDVTTHQTKVRYSLRAIPPYQWIRSGDYTASRTLQPYRMSCASLQLPAYVAINNPTAIEEKMLDELQRVGYAPFCIAASLITSGVPVTWSNPLATLDEG